MKTITAKEQAEYMKASGSKQISMAQLEREINAIGYTLDRSDDCKGNNKYVTGPREGIIYPAVNLHPIEKDTRMSFANVNSRRDSNYKALKKMRKNETFFCLIRGRICTL